MDSGLVASYVLVGATIVFVITCAVYAINRIYADGQREAVKSYSKSKTRLISKGDDVDDIFEENFSSVDEPTGTVDIFKDTQKIKPPLDYDGYDGTSADFGGSSDSGDSGGGDD